MQRHSKGELKPCPFCGGVAELDSMRLDYFRIRCANCDAQTSFRHQTERTAVNAWNRRAYE